MTKLQSRHTAAPGLMQCTVSLGPHTLSDLRSHANSKLSPKSSWQLHPAVTQTVSECQWPPCQAHTTSHMFGRMPLSKAFRNDMPHGCGCGIHDQPSSTHPPVTDGCTSQRYSSVHVDAYGTGSAPCKSDVWRSLRHHVRATLTSGNAKRAAVRTAHQLTFNPGCEYS